MLSSSLVLRTSREVLAAGRLKINFHSLTYNCRIFSFDFYILSYKYIKQNLSYSVYKSLDKFFLKRENNSISFLA